MTAKLVDAGEVESPLPVCRTGVLPLSLRAQIWYPVEGSSLRHPVCKTGALPSELTGQILVRAARLELAHSPSKSRVFCHSNSARMEPTPRIERGFRPYRGRALPLSYAGWKP